MLRRLLVAVVAGLAATLAFEPLAQAWMLPLALAALVGALHGQSVRRGALLGLAFGVAFMTTLQWWMRVIGTDAWVAISLVEAAFLGVFGAGAAVLLRRRLWPLTVAVLWLAIEVWRSQWPFSGMPWGRLAFASIDTPLAQALPWVGANGVGLLTALLGTTLAWLVLEGRRRRTTALAAVAAVAGLVAWPVLAPWTPQETGRAPVAAVQGNVPGDGSDILLDYRQVTRNHRDATVDLAERVADGRSTEPTFVLWPENSTAVDPFRDAETRGDIETASRAIGVPILVGGIVDAEEDGKLLNQGIVWNPGTGGGDRYTKRHPVPFGEYVPWRGNPFTDRFQRLDLVPRDMLGGTRLTPLRIGGLLVADAICFDVAYDDGLYAQVRRGAQLVTVQTSNAIYIHTHQVDQQFAITRTRALETGRSVAVASPNGVSALIGPDGEVLVQASKRVPTVLEASLPLTDDVPPAVVVGEWLGRGSVVVAAVSVLMALLSYRRRRDGNSRPGRDVDQVAPSPTAEVHA